jgi:hypothetical protein
MALSSHTARNSDIWNSIESVLKTEGRELREIWLFRGPEFAGVPREVE